MATTTSRIKLLNLMGGLCSEPTERGTQAEGGEADSGAYISDVWCSNTFVDGQRFPDVDLFSDVNHINITIMLVLFRFHQTQTLKCTTE